MSDVVITNIKEVRRTTSEKEANFLLEQGWKMVSITPIGTHFQYLLVRE